ncbi:hypothetical protein D3C86_1335380 [compost metagenome]
MDDFADDGGAGADDRYGGKDFILDGVGVGKYPCIAGSAGTRYRAQGCPDRYGVGIDNEEVLNLHIQQRYDRQHENREDAAYRMPRNKQATLYFLVQDDRCEIALAVAQYRCVGRQQHGLMSSEARPQILKVRGRDHLIAETVGGCEQRLAGGNFVNDGRRYRADQAQHIEDGKRRQAKHIFENLRQHRDIDLGIQHAHGSAHQLRE